MELTIDINKLAAMKLFTAKKDVRYYLNGVLLEIGSRESRLVATDGHVMAIMRLDFCRPGPTQRIIIPSEALAGIKPAKRSAPATITVDGTDDVVELRIDANCGKAWGKHWQWFGNSIDGHYPDYMRVVPRTVSGEAAQFNGEYLAAFHKAAEILGGYWSNVGYNGGGPALVTIGGTLANDDFVGVLMPVKDQLADHPRAPAWASESLEALQVAA